MHKAEQGFIHIKAYKQGWGSKIGEDKKKKGIRKKNIKTTLENPWSCKDSYIDRYEYISLIYITYMKNIYLSTKIITTVA